ncbi:MAG: rhodanese-like domain-containing protein [Acidimicrobiales bacterium]
MIHPSRPGTSEPSGAWPRFDTVDALLAHARAELARLTPHQAYERARAGSVIVDIRPGWQRARDGEVAGALIIERNHLEWRLHPRSKARLQLSDRPREWIIMCEGGYSSSLAAASLRSLGVPATDVIGGCLAWAAAGLPLRRSVTPPEGEVPS